MKTKRSLLVLLLALCMVITGIPCVPVVANEQTPTTVLSGEDAISLDYVVSLEHLLDEPKQQDVIVPLSETSCQILRYVDNTEFEEGNHIARILNEETLSSYVFLNEDGSRTTYWMDEPVKFKNADGLIQEKDLTLKNTAEGYVTSKNDVQLVLPLDPLDGIRLAYSNTTVLIVPEGGNTNSEIELTDNSVTYLNYFGDGMSLRYTPTSCGVKEDVLLDAYYGINSFSFMLHTGGLNLYQSNGGFYLAESKLATNRIDLGDVVSYDATANFSIGNMTSDTIIAGQLYRITISVDEDFLTDENTTYPVTIDPTLTVSYDNNGDDYIVDAPIFEGYPSNNYGAFQYNRVGYVDASFQSGRTAVKFPLLTNSDTYLGLKASEITSVKFYVKEATGTSGISVSVYPLTQNSTWAESNLTWNNVGARASTVAATGTLTDSAWTAFDITTLVKQWKVGTYNANCGFIMIGANEDTTDKAFCASEFTKTNYRPYVVMTYSEDTYTGGSSFDTAETITINSSITVNTTVASERVYIKFTPSVTKEYIFYSSNNTTTGDPMVLVYDANRTLLNGDDDAAGNKNFRYARTLTAGQTYYFELGHYGQYVGSYSVKILSAYNLSNGTCYLYNEGTGYYLDIHGPTEQELVHQWEYHTGDQMKWTFASDSDGFYTIRSKYGDEKYVGISSTSVGVNNVVLLSSVSDNAKWKIYLDETGNFVFEPKNAKGRKLYAPDSLMGTELQLAYLSATSYSRDLWDTVIPSHSHSYSLNATSAKLHPHKTIWKCECGASYDSYLIYSTCSICRENQQEAVATITESPTLWFWAGDLGTGFGGFYSTVVTCTFTYSNSYSYPFSMTYDYPPFASFESSAIITTQSNPDTSAVVCSVDRFINYYTSSGTLIETQELMWGSDGTKSAFATEQQHPYTLQQTPSYAVANVGVMIEYGLGGHDLSVTAYFS